MLCASRRVAASAFRRLLDLLLLTALSSLTGMPRSFAEETRFFRIVSTASTTITTISPEGFVTWTNSVTNVTCTVQSTLSLVSEADWCDYVHVPVSNHVVTIRLFDPKPPSGMVLIPAGSFSMGDAFNDLPKHLNAHPTHTVCVSAFYIAVVPVTKCLWDEVKSWALSNGYELTNHMWNPKPANYPCIQVPWYDAVKWCNARSQKENLIPCYYINGTMTHVYMAGEVTNPFVNWSASGYRLPTEAEWEKAARGGLSGKRFPWGDTITHSQANYYSSTNFGYDISPTRGWHPDYTPTGSTGYYATSPVGMFGPNGYGLYDMCGNVFDWCWDWDGLYSSDAQLDPKGPDSGTQRMRRGGNWNDDAQMARCDYRFPAPPTYGRWGHGFRVVRSHQ